MFADDAEFTALSGWREVGCGLGDLPGPFQGEWDFSMRSHCKLAFKSVERLCLPGVGCRKEDSFPSSPLLYIC